MIFSVASDNEYIGLLERFASVCAELDRAESRARDLREDRLRIEGALMEANRARLEAQAEAQAQNEEPENAEVPADSS